jgi:hypothetical protein
VAAVEKLAVEAARIYQDVADYYGVAWAAAQLSRAELERGDVKRARARAEESLTLLRRYGMHEGLLTIVLGAAGDAALAGGALDVAAARFREGLALRANRRAGVLRVALLDGLARVAAARNRPTLALRLAGAATAERARLGALAPPIEREWLDRALAPFRPTMTDQAWSAAYAQGQALTLEQAIVTALEENDT